MKQIPASFKACSMTATGASMFTPNSTSTSADPVLLVILRLPCFATEIPVAAATIIIVVCIPIFAHFFCGATLSLVIAVALLSCLIITKHTENIFKILNGTESTFWSVFKK